MHYRLSSVKASKILSQSTTSCLALKTQNTTENAKVFYSSKNERAAPKSASIDEEGGAASILGTPPTIISKEALPSST